MPEVTYKQLHEILQSLGFTRHEPEPGTVVYRLKNSEAMVILPAKKGRELVPQHHLVGTKMILEAFGIMDPLEFTTRLVLANSKSA
jgi:hypothetical protein